MFCPCPDLPDMDIVSEFPEPTHCMDIIALPKQHMHHTALQQKPFVICPYSYKEKLDLRGPLRWAEFRAMPANRIEKLRRTARTLRQMRPWDMTSAADYLDRWLDESEMSNQPCGAPDTPDVFQLLWKHNERHRETARQGPTAGWTNFVQTSKKLLTAKPKPKPKAKADAKAKAKAKNQAKAKARPRRQQEAPSSDSSSSSGASDDSGSGCLAGAKGWASPLASTIWKSGVKCPTRTPALQPLNPARSEGTEEE